MESLLMAHTLDASKVGEILDAIEDEHMSRLSKWETGFIESQRDKRDRGYEMSEREMEILEQIWVKMP
jgi:hypothetical protein